MIGIDVAALRARAVEQQAQCDKQTATDPVVTGVWLRSRFHPVTNPAVVLEMLDRLAAAEGAVARAAETLDDLALTLMSTSDDNPTGDTLTAAVVSRCAEIVRQEQP